MAGLGVGQVVTIDCSRLGRDDREISREALQKSQRVLIHLARKQHLDVIEDRGRRILAPNCLVQNGCDPNLPLLFCKVKEPLGKVKVNV
jgi:hypothetical protein